VLVDRPLAGSTALSVAVHAAAIAVLLASVPPPAAPPVLVDLVVLASEDSAKTTPPDVRQVERKSVDKAPRRAAPVRPTPTGTEHAPEARPGELSEAEPAGAVPTAHRPTAPAQPSETASDVPAPGPSAPPTTAAADLLQAETGSPSAATNVETPPSSDSRPAPARPQAGEPRADAQRPLTESSEGSYRSPGPQTARAVPAPGPAAFSAPRLEHKGRPRYPEAARAAGIEGTVILRIHVLANGEVAAAEVSRSAGHAVLDRAAMESIRGVRFVPARRGDEPVSMWVEVPVQFRLER
jgi:protein TonB